MDGFCNTSFWNTSSSWDTVVPSVSPCFEHTVLVWLPCSFAWLLGICEASILVHSDNRDNSYSTLFVTKLIFQALTFIVCTAKLVVSSLLYLRYATDLAEVAGCSVLICTLVLVTGLTLLERRKGLRSSLAIPTFWLLFAICMAITFYADVVNFTFDLQNVTPLCSFLLLLLTVVQLVLSSLSEKPPPYVPLERQPHQCVLKEWTIIPRIFFAHMWRIVMLGYHGKLDVSTLHQLCTDLTCATTFIEFHKAAFMKPRPLRALVDEQGSLVRAPQTQEKKQRSLYWVVFRVCWFQLLASTVLEVIGVFVSFLPPYMLSLILTFVQSKEYTWHGYVYACGYAGFLFLSGVLDAHAVYFTEFAAFRAQSSLLAALYRKVFRLAPSARRHYLAGDVMNFMSVDVEEVSSFLTLSTQVWTVPLRIVLTLVLLWHYLGASCLATLGVMFAAVLATTYVATLCDRYQEKQMALKDKRMRLISEILNGIKVLKLSGWEVPFMERVQQTRLQEVSYLRKFSLLDSVFGFLWTCAPYLFVVSMGRLAKFLGEAELDRNAVGTSPEQGHSVTLKNATLSWSREEAPVLKDLTLSVKTGSLVAVVGSVGSGKSSLLSAILGTLEKVSGTIDVEGRLAYVPQQSWIQNATVKGNVVFMNRLDEDRYREVIESCALLPDLEILPGGENTEIGEKGINLSGGQKLRLSLARAVYHDADVYLLDDPFSAVDVHVAAHLFEHVVGPTGILKSKTRILVTHSVTYLPQVDWIVLLNHGVVQEQGTYADLVGREGSKFAEFIQHHVKAHPSANSLTAANGSRNRPVDEQKTGVEADKCTLVEEETLCTGYVGSHVYGMYFKRVGWRFLIPALITCILAFGSEYGSAVWLSKWSQDGDVSQRHFYITGYALFLASYVVFNFVFWSIFVVGTLRAAIWFHQQLLNGIMRSPLSFFDTTPMGRIINRFSRDVESVDKEIPINANMTMCNIVWGMQLLILICIMSPYFTIVVVMAVLLFASVTIVSLPAFRQVQRLRSVTRSPILTHISESIAGVVSVRAFGVTKQFINALERCVDVNINCCYHSISLDCCRLTIANTLALVVSLGASLLTIAGRNSLSPGMIGLVLSYTLEVSNAASYTFRMFALLETSLVAVERIKEYIGLTEEAPWRNADSQPDADWPARGNIAYSNYSAAYRDNLALVLKGINIKIYDGQKIGIVGRTGAGKSTLALALFRIIEPRTGKINLDHVDISKIGLHDLRSKMTIIPQDPVLFAGTLRWNLDPCEDYTDDALWEALEQAHLKDFVATQDAGLDYEVLEGGENLSAGQRQLVCLTRALLRKSKVLVLDEATSSVDMATDHLIKDTIHREFSSTTMITIAHRLHTIMDCDRIIVLSGGEIVEQGTPAELVQKEDGLFLSMAKDAGLV
ncbi:multidrug resistance-associated protein 1 isoform X3 [Rhipicephalus microplus]|uniref:multidrug resistance-associated protein 1 isoform X3 n=1 Tax=Rhipicephalus microplus TaxID=6941 RepID=UPI003F6C0F84